MVIRQIRIFLIGSNMTKANLCTVEKVMNYRKDFKTRIRLASDLIRLGFSKKGTKHEILTAFVVLLGNA